MTTTEQAKATEEAIKNSPEYPAMLKAMEKMRAEYERLSKEWQETGLRR